jgi:hypothetical protein
MADATEPSPQPAEDLERALAEIDSVIAAGDKWPPGHGLAAQLSLAEARAIRAALARKRELEQWHGHVNSDERDRIHTYVQLREEANRALDRERELRAALEGYIEWAAELNEEEPFTIQQRGMASAFAEDFKALLVQPAAGKERER